MNDRDCKNCIRETIDGCTAWDCEYINRKEAIAVWKEYVEEYREKHREDSNGKTDDNNQ